MRLLPQIRYFADTLFNLNKISLKKNFIIGLLMLMGAPFQVMAQQKITTYYDEGKSVPKEVFHVNISDSTVLNGVYEAFFSDSTLKTRGLYQNNVPNGQWEYFYENGLPKMRGTVENGVNQGNWEYFYENGKPQMGGPIFNNLRQGNWKFYFENGKLKSEGPFENGQQTGIWNYWYEDGNLKAQEFFNADSSRYKEFYSSEVLKLEGNNVSGKKEGFWKFYHENGNLKAEGNYKNDERQGNWKFYNEKGLLASSGLLVNGQSDGAWTYYHENGNISAEGIEKNGYKEGSWKLYHGNGDFKGEAEFANGEGVYKEYYDNGQVKVTGKVVKEVNQGKWQYFYEDGTLEGDCVFVNGSGKYTGYYPDGTVKMKGTIKNGERVGIWELYHPDESLAGYYKNVYENDKPVFRIVEDSLQQLKNENLLTQPLNPDYLYRKRSKRFFQERINEFRGVIISINPAGLLANQFPVSAEYYVQERLGYEFEAGLQRKPLFSPEKDIAVNKVYYQGFFAALKQKFYYPDTKLGIPYLGHRIGYRTLKHFANLDTNSDGVAVNPPIMMELASEQQIEYSVLIGSRFMRDTELINSKLGKNKRFKGFTADIFGGIGIGYRFFNDYPSYSSTHDALHKKINQKKITVPYHIGLSIGYVF